MAFMDDKPRYIKVKEAILQQILSGHLQVGEKMPGERKIANKHKVSQMTANRAIQELVKEGYLEREMGVGTFVISKDPVRRMAPKVNIVLFGELGKERETEKTPKRNVSNLREVDYNRDYDATYLTMEYLSKDIYMGTMLRSLMEAGYVYGCEFAFLTVAQPYEMEQYVQNADRNRESFVLINPLESWSESIRCISKSGMPAVAISAHWENMGVPYVDTDNYNGAKMAIKHLYSLGHTQIAVFYSWPETANTRDRILGAKDAMQELGFNLDDEMFCNILSTSTQGIGETKKALGNIIANDKMPTAIFAAGFELALAVNTALRYYNLSIPEDVSLIGFDDSPAAIYLQPPLTTIKQPLHEMAKEAISIIMSKHKESRAKIIPVELILRNSTAIVREQKI